MEQSREIKISLSKVQYRSQLSQMWKKKNYGSIWKYCKYLNGWQKCISDLTGKLNLAPSTVWKMIKRGEWNPHTNAMHLEISEENKMVTIRWVFSLLQHNSITVKTTILMLLWLCSYRWEMVLLVKKITSISSKNEPKPYRKGKSLKFVPKIMFMGCVARPRWVHAKAGFHAKLTTSNEKSNITTVFRVYYYFRYQVS